MKVIQIDDEVYELIKKEKQRHGSSIKFVVKQMAEVYFKENEKNKTSK